MSTKNKKSFENDRNIGLYSLAIVISLVVGIGGNVIYDWFIKGHAYVGLCVLLLTFILVVYFAITANKISNRLKKLRK